MGTIPGSRLQIGGTSTIDVVGYFSDPDGDELSYTGASSNETVATIAMEGSTATITAVAAGDAVITITASDGSASVSQGFRIDVPAGPEEATVVISRLLDANRNQISDPTGISGTIYAVLDVQSNDETWTEIGLTLNGETVSPLCRGTGGSSADVAVGPGLAAAGQVEIECLLKTNDVLGECMGMQLDPKYANGEYELSAFLTTDEGATRDVVASQPIALKNHGFVQIRHMPGSETELGNHTKGLTFYGGPAVEGNVNSFYACPVAYDGTTVGSMALQTVVTDTEQNPVSDARGPTFRTRNGGQAFPVDDEAPFMWSIITDWWSGNHAYYRTGAENIPGENETWIVNGGIITDPNGLDVSATFRPGGEEAKLGPLHFDYTAPRTDSDNSELAISRLRSNALIWTTTREEYYSDGSSSNPMRLWITDMVERGVGHVYGTTSAIAVGDCSVRGNADTRGSTAFTPLDGLDNVTHISQLPEEDPVRDAVNDGGGIDCYVAEVQALADRLGNAVVLSEEPRIRTVNTFGVDRTPPVISRERPSEALVLNENELSFEIEDPRFESGEDGSQQMAEAYAWAGDSRYWITGGHYWSDDVDMSTGSATVDITPRGPASTHRFSREEEHTVYVRALDKAGNAASTSFTFVRDHSPPVLALSAVPSDFGLTQAASVSVTVAGTLSDATEIRRAFLSVHHGETCTEANPLESSQASSPVRRLHNGTNKIEFSEVFTIKKAGDLGATDYCFFLRSEDDARDADGGAHENSYDEVVGTFSVTWPGVKPAGPVAVGTVADMDLAIGAMETVDVSGNFSDANGDALTYTAASSDDAVATVSMEGAMATVTAVTAGMATITVTAEDAPGTGTAEQSWDVTVQPATVYGLVFTDDADMPLTMVSVDEGSGAMGGTTYKVALDQMPSEDVTVTITVAEANRAGFYATLSTDELTFTSDNYMTAQEVTVTTLDHDDNATAEMFTLMHDPSGAEYEDAASAEVAGMVNDDEVALMASLMSLGENDDTTAVTVSVETGVANPGAGDDSNPRTITVTLGGSSAGQATDGTDFGALAADKETPISGASFDIVLAEGATSKDTMIYIVPTDDADEEDDEAITVAGTISGGLAPTAPVASNLVADDEIELEDNDPDVMLSTDVTSVAEDVEDPVEVTVTVTATDRRSVDRTFTVAVAVPSGRAETVANFTITVAPGDLSGTGTFNLDPTGNTADDGDATVTVSISSVAPATKENGVNYTFGTTEITITDNDDS